MADVTLSELQSLRADLVRARMSGVKQIIRNGATITYASDKDMARAIADADAQINDLLGNTSPRVTGGAVDMFS